MTKRGPAFWKCWRSKFDSKNRRVMQVDGPVNDTDIVDKFESFFSQACSVNTEQGSDKLKSSI